jgi:hypothetical protein
MYHFSLCAAQGKKLTELRTAFLRQYSANDLSMVIEFNRPALFVQRIGKFAEYV